MNTKILNLIVALKVLEGLAKDLHYSAVGVSFRALHEQADAVQTNLGDYRDLLNELYFLGENKEVPLAGTIFKMAAEQLGTQRKSVPQLISALISQIRNLKLMLKDTLATGPCELQDILGRIAADVQQNLGFLEQVQKGLK